MTQKEKVKAYDEALERAKKEINIKGIGETVELCEELFPQLRESDIEDEKIRKELINALMCQRDSFSAKGPYDNNVILPGFKMKIGKILAYLEKQKEQKPAEWGEEDEEMLEYVIGDVNDAKQLFATKDAIALCDREIAWLKSLRPSWKPSEEQINALERTIRLANFGAEVDRRKALESLYEQLKKLM